MTSFAQQLNAFGEKAKVKQEQALRKVSFELFSRVIMRTPVKTGRLRGNWQATTDKPAQSEVNRDDNQAPTNQRGVGSSSAKQAMEELVLGIGNPTVFHLTNPLPYARVIEYGDPHGSEQAPQGMVRVSVAEFQDVVNQVAGAV